jgi:hypothetical protein
MKVLSWDIGRKNMAFCHLDTQPNDKPTILHWASIDISASGSTTRDFTENLIDYIHAHTWMSTDVDICVMEVQSRFAPLLQCFACAIHACLYAINPQMKFANISASSKFKKFAQIEIEPNDSKKQVYTKHKRLAQCLCKSFLRQWSIEAGICEQYGATGYNTDMADALCNAAAYLGVHHKDHLPKFDDVLECDQDLS